MYSNLVKIKNEKNGPEYRDTPASVGSLASTYHNQGRLDEVEKLEIQVMETSKTALGAEHPDTLASMANLAYTWKSQDRLQDALALIEKCSELCRRLGPNHSHTRSASRAFSNWMDERNLFTKHL
ncbi:hypothetical protein BDV29DRAFT_62628 [Aspergillus leporis]|uniref:Tetratricopeptide repeat-domain-containing protein n=1 Tax=Aspergillus leporis TaxID=41062 RepID=A0A5N5WJU8_9EURO|nr:hypothetical protein BDV29DRAFT_62628 [Aspergillus leporis]